jgi:hypothetical protein
MEGNAKTYFNLVGIYLSALTLALVLCFIIGGITNYYSNNYTYSSVGSLPKTLPIAMTSMFNGYSEIVQLQTNMSVSYLMRHLANLNMGGIENSEATCALLLLAVASLIMFDYFDKEYSLGIRYNYAGAAVLFGAFFISLIASQYIASYYYFSIGDSVSGLSLFQVDSSATVIIFTSMALASALSAYYAFNSRKKLRLSELLTIFLIGMFMIIIPFNALSADLGFVNPGSLPASSYQAHSLGLMLFYGVFIISYVSLKSVANRKA